MSLTNDEIERIRQQALSMVERAASDAEFRAHIQSDPQGTLTAAGLPADAVDDFMNQLRKLDAQGADVSGYSIISICCYKSG